MGWFFLILGIIIFVVCRVARFIFDGLLAILPQRVAAQVRAVIHFAAALFLLIGLISLIL